MWVWYWQAYEFGRYCISITDANFDNAYGNEAVMMVPGTLAQMLEDYDG